MILRTRSAEARPLARKVEMWNNNMKNDRSDIYEAIRPRLNTGDVVLFSGKGGISAGIKWFTGSEYSHVGMVVRMDSGIYLWESSTLTNEMLPDVMAGKVRKGVRRVSLSDTIRFYPGPMTIRMVEHPQETGEINRIASGLLEEFRGRSYERRKLSMISGHYGWENKEDLSSLFCSELVAEAFQRFGWIPERQSSDSFWPVDFAPGGSVEGMFTASVAFGDEISL